MITNDKTGFKPAEFEKKWQQEWEDKKLFSPDLKNAKKPFYNLMMFPYPSAEGLHVGNMYAFTGADVYGRYQRMSGNDVFEPIGLDGFGIHSENYALKVGRHPAEQAKVSEQNFYRQLRSIGNSFDWQRTLETYDSEYYRWTQWLFVQMFKNGLAYREKAEVNWCPGDLTVLSDEQVIDGKCERCGSAVEKRELEQWFFRITKYAERLLNNIDKLDWSERVKIAQKQWIGKSEDAEIDFAIKGSSLKVKVVTTRADTIFGATFLVLAPEHELVQKFKPDIQNWNEAEDYIKASRSKTEFERGQTRDKTGVKLEGVTAVNPVNNEEIPVFIADYVLSTYGTGAIMAVPAHDDRDFNFAKKFGLPIIPVIEQPKQSNILRIHLDDKDLSGLAQELRKMGKPMEYWTPTLRRYDIQTENAQKVSKMLSGVGVGTEEQLVRIEHGDSFELEFNPVGITFGTVYSGDGKHISSEFLNGLDNLEAISTMVSWLSEKNLGRKSVHYHLRDWLISRQRYWGSPIPMTRCETCAKNGKGEREEMPGWYSVPETDLPVLLPDVKDWKPMGTGLSPLANHPEFYETNCPGCGASAKRETDVSDTFLDSAWYFLRYTSIDAESIPYDTEIVKKWLPVKMYIGGAEHSVLHLLYSRFVTMVLADLKMLDFEEPFTKFFAHGLIIKDGVKMSKSKGNVVVPDEYIKKYGADTLRMYLMFIGPFSQGGDFRDTGIEGMHRFSKKVWRLVTEAKISNDKSQIPNKIQNEEVTKLNTKMHQTIKDVTEDIQDFKYNTALAFLMEYYNVLSEFYAKYKILDTTYCKTFVLLLAPFAPHMTEELWEKLGDTTSSIHQSAWPKYDDKYLVEDEVTIAIQVNGKTRGTVALSSSSIQNKDEIETKAKEAVSKHLEDKTIIKVIHVPGKVVNFVV